MRRISTVLLITLLAGTAATGQTTRSAQDTRQAYGARLTNPADDAALLNQRRINNRVNSRINSRLSTRIERYRVGASADPAAAYQRTDTGSAAQAIEQAEAAGRQAAPVLGTPSQFDPYADPNEPTGGRSGSAPR